jgi:hypothetical protein
MKFHEARLYADPDAAARKIVEIANGLEPYMDSRLLVERINGPFLRESGNPHLAAHALDKATALTEQVEDLFADITPRAPDVQQEG